MPATVSPAPWSPSRVLAGLTILCLTGQCLREWYTLKRPIRRRPHPSVPASRDVASSAEPPKQYRTRGTTRPPAPSFSPRAATKQPINRFPLDLCFGEVILSASARICGVYLLCGKEVLCGLALVGGEHTTGEALNMKQGVQPIAAEFHLHEPVRFLVL